MIESSIQGTPPAARKKHRNLAQGVVENITSSIQGGSLKPGEKLPTESAIMQIHGVSRTVVREAISHLQAAGLVETRHGIGTFVLEPAPASLGIPTDAIITVRDVLAVLELRISLETEAAWLAAARRTEAQAEQMQVLLRKMRDDSDAGDQSVDHDVHLHLLIAEATGNRYFVEFLRHLGTTIIPRARFNAARIVQDDPVRYIERLNREHDEICQAIVRRDPEAARAAMRTHLSNSRERLRRAQEMIEAGQP